MNMEKETYKKFADAHAPHSPIGKNCLFAFLFGGGICTLAQGLQEIFLRLCHMEKEDAATLTSVTLISSLMRKHSLSRSDNIFATMRAL